MTDYNPDEMAEQAQEARESFDGLSGEITEIETGTAEDFFGDNVQGEADKQMLKVTVDLDGDGEVDEITDYFSRPTSDQSWANPTFGLARFQAKYGDVPRVGQEVAVVVGDDGFMEIDLPDSTADVE